MKCCDCLYAPHCTFYDNREFTPKERFCFAERSEWVHLPCNVGDKVYFLCRNRETYEWYICEKEVYSIMVYDNSTHIYVSPICSFVEMEIGNRLFLTREEAEKARKEMDGNDT